LNLDSKTKKRKQEKILLWSLIFVLILIFTVFSDSGLQPSGFNILTETLKITLISESLNVKTNESTVYVWEPSVPGILTSVKISGSVYGKERGIATIYLENFLVYSVILRHDENKTPIPENQTEKIHQQINFTEVCNETCNLTKEQLNQTIYNITIQVSNVTLKVKNISYTVLEEITKKIVKKANEEPSKGSYVGTMTAVPAEILYVDDCSDYDSRGTLTDTNCQGTSDGITSNVAGRWAGNSLWWNFKFQNASQTSHTFEYANLTIHNFRVSGGWNDDESAFEYSDDGGITWYTIELWSTTNPPPSTATTKTYAIPNVDSWIEVNKTMFRIEGRTRNGGADNWAWYMDAAYLDTKQTDNPPTWNNPSINPPVPYPKDTVSHNVLWDDDFNLSHAKLEINSSGIDCNTKSNVTSTTLTGIQDWANLTYTLSNSCEGRTIAWKQYANDSINQGNSTNIQTYQVQNVNPLASFGPAPLDNYTSTSENIAFELRGSDNYQIDALQLYGNWTGTWEAKETNFSPVNNSFWTVTVNNVPDGKNHIWGVRVNDSRGNFDFTDANRTFKVDTMGPNITNPGIDKTEVNVDRYFCINITITEISHVDKVSAEVYNTQERVNYTLLDNSLSACGGIIGDGIYGRRIYVDRKGMWNYSKVYANDTLGNKNSYDFPDLQTNATQLPTITIIKPKNKTYLIKNSLKLEFLIYNSTSIWYNLDNTGNITITDTTFFNTTLGTHTLYLYANNSYGTNKENVTFYVNSTKILIIDDEFDETSDHDYNDTENKRKPKKGESTDLYDYGYEELQSLPGLKFENSNGKISFKEDVNLTYDENPSDNMIDINDNVEISKNKIEINSTNFPGLNKSAQLSLYNLKFKRPRILRDGEICPSNICEKISYSGGTLVFNVTQFTKYSAEEGPEKIERTPDSSAGIFSFISEDFTINPSEISFNYPRGHYSEEKITITNNQYKKINISIENLGVKNFLDVEFAEIKLNGRETKNITLYINIPENVETTIYIGRIIFSSENLEKEIPVSIGVESPVPGLKGALLDVKTNIPEEYREILPGESLLIETNLFNLGFPGREDIFVEYRILDEEGNEIISEHETRALETETSFIKELKIPSETEAGNYLLYIRAIYNGKVSSASAWFEIKDPLITPKTKVYIVIILSTIVITGTIIYLIIRSRQRLAKTIKKISGKKEIGKKR